MILGALLLLLVGSADLLRVARLGRVATVVSVVVVWAVLVVVVVAGVGVPWWWVVVVAGFAAVWLATTSAKADVRRASGILPGIGVLVVVAVSLVSRPSLVSAQGFLVDWHGSAPPAVAAVPLATLVFALGALLFLIESSNIIVRAALRPAVEESDAADAAAMGPGVAGSGSGAPEHAVPTPGRRRWWSRPPVVATVSAPVPDLKGGRLIGPLERLLIVALTLAGALPIVAGIFAAKGIVRFPEISADGARGSKAEYFLVGSLVSWSLALALAGGVWISAHS
ncbi:hypothetical protein SCB71_10650 [Herbiconiux sp. KACC 21604]|uniref:hypothetical protein n=1 Tax=unclassified Herbiconiux TaxID=2618217 RepID=UPI001490CCF2|nr:hypothetical protein [Herbiconiux sp. SALV-R1]QJU53687.1 hypothetical protein HL652_08600 [Herbiconiux sp. SALV-R1]WPO84690.1 hypothetical protein SCB71_10650 [Herbiconiux sp. KACC 21604]